MGCRDIGPREYSPAVGADYVLYKAGPWADHLQSEGQTDVVPAKLRDTLSTGKLQLLPLTKPRALPLHGVPLGPHQTPLLDQEPDAKRGAGAPVV